jgi:hypothetical protein
MKDKIFEVAKNHTENEETAMQLTNELCVLLGVSGSSIVIPKPKLKFEGIDNISIVSENNIPLSELFELHLKLENFLKSRPESIVNADGNIVGFNNYR